jgi:hypothetical protein
LWHLETKDEGGNVALVARRQEVIALVTNYEDETAARRMSRKSIN